MLAASVIVSHSFALPAGTDRVEPLYIFSQGQRTTGGMAVDAFFILSGLLISQSWQSTPRAGRFLLKRGLRILPGFLAATLLAMTVLVPLASGWAPIRDLDWGATLRSVANLGDFQAPGSFPANPFRDVVNGSLWSIRYEAWCYLGVLGLGLLPQAFRGRWLLVALFVATLAGSFAYSALHLHLGGGWVGRVAGNPGLWARLAPCFVAGVVFHRFRSEIPASPILAAMCAVVLVVSCRTSHGLSVAAPTAGAYLLFFLAFVNAGPLSSWGRSGDFSYGLYVYAFPVQQLLIHHLGTSLPWWDLAARSLAVTLPLAILSWHMVERPALRLCRERRAPIPRSES